MPIIDIDLDGRYQQLVFRSPHSVWVSLVLVVVTNVLLFLPTRVWEADLSNAGIHTVPQLLGMLLLFTLVPMWMLACFFVTQRHSLALALQLEAAADSKKIISTDILRFPLIPVVVGLLAGLGYAAVFNIPTSQFSLAMGGNWPVLSILLGQTILWVCVGMLLFVRLHIAGLFSALGRTIEFSIFDQTPLKAFARVGLLDVVIIVGGMVIASVQSLDAHFRSENYLSAALVAVPAAIALLIRPMWRLHERMQQRRDLLRGEVAEKIRGAGIATDLEDARLLEDWLQRRDRINALHTWPLDIGIWRRLIFYILIPPLAWAGAALMEAGVNRALGL